MAVILEKLDIYFQYDFVRYALITGVLTALCSSLLGVTLVLKRLSFIGDGLSHTAFGATAFASVIGLKTEMPFTLIFTSICAVILLRRGKKAKVNGDASTAVLSTGALAAGYLLMNMFAVSPNVSGDVCTTLFGSTSILTLRKNEVVLCIAMSALVLLVFIVFYNRIFTITFDEDFARASGIPTEFYNTVTAVITAVIIVLGIKLVGSLLICALIVFPPLAAMRVFKSFLSVTVCAAVLSVLCAVIGITASIAAGTPVGPTIAVTEMAAFIFFSLAEKLSGVIKR